MTEKNQQEKMAAERQVELFTHAFEKAKDNGGVWLDNKGRKAPGLYQKHLQVSPFNAIILGMHADQNNYKTNQYTLFSDAKKRGESVQTKEKAYLSYGTAGTSMSARIILMSGLAVPTTKPCQQSNSPTTRASVPVRFVHCSI